MLLQRSEKHFVLLGKEMKIEVKNEPFHIFYVDASSVNIDL